jgi:peptidoglycan/xylan/chitin deacetylase (PgdA/CDA1 family)
MESQADPSQMSYPAGRASGVPILMYHEVADQSEVDQLARKTQRGYILLCNEFEQQMSYLASAGFHAISLRQLYDWTQSGVPLPANPIVITFDDGFAGNYRHAYPVLLRLGLTATFFVVTKRIDDQHMLNWGQLREMHRHGMAIESHTVNHPLLSTLTEARTRDELGGSRRTIEDRLGGVVQFLSLPNGDSNPFYVAAAREAGYLGGCGSRFGLNFPATNCFFWRRIAIKQGIDIDRFRGIVSRRPSTLFFHGSKAAAKAAVAAALGKRNYDRLYNRIFGVQEQDKSKQP